MLKILFHFMVKNNKIKNKEKRIILENFIVISYLKFEKTEGRKEGRKKLLLDTFTRGDRNRIIVVFFSFWNDAGGLKLYCGFYTIENRGLASCIKVTATTIYAFSITCYFKYTHGVKK